MPTDRPLPVIAIIGGGASGTLVAANLLREATAGVRVLLFERMSELGRGVAYGTRCPQHLLNVPAGRMSAHPDDPEHFFRWAAARAGRPGYPATVAPGDYLPRTLYGDYLGEVLQQARAAAVPGVDFQVIKGEVVDLERPEAGGPVRLRCGDGYSFAADRVVLAIGNLPGEYPLQRPLPVYHSQRYVHVPWRPGSLAGIPPDSEVLLVGAGLTATDIILELAESGHRGRIHALSRRGYLPQAHRPSAPYPDFLAGEKLPPTVAGVVRRLRQELRRAADRNMDWRPVLDSLRPHTIALWQGWSWAERARFLRHVRPLWDVHRHRIAAPVATRLEKLRKSGQVRYYAGRLSSLSETPEGVQARFRLRATERVETVLVASVINCTGPRTDYSKYQHPLLINLLASGLITHDPLALGLLADADGAVSGVGGRSSRDGELLAGPRWLYTLAAPLKAMQWECTAMPEIRVQAQRLARELLH